jgi:hypothetical protein
LIRWQQQSAATKSQNAAAKGRDIEKWLGVCANRIGDSMGGFNTADQVARTFDPAVAMFRITCFLGISALVVVWFGAFSPSPLQSVAVGLVVAFGSTVVGALLGFIFGVPFSKDVSPNDQAESGDKSKDSLQNLAISRYRPNTSLEQISEWLSKMLVGVGLVELKSIGRQLYNLANFIATGFGKNDKADAPAEVFAYFGVLLFAGCGFIFGFIWARIYLRRWFTQADQEAVKTLDDKISKIETDVRALALVNQQLYRSPEEKPVSTDEFTGLFKNTSRVYKAQIFDLARKTSGDTDKSNPEYAAMNGSAISILRALVADDPGGYFHRTRAELAYALGRQRDIDGAIGAISQAIDLRNEHQIPGWKYYEFRRARFRIEREGDNLTRGVQSSPDLKRQIMNDITVARADSKWADWINRDSGNLVTNWLKLNEPNFDGEQLRGL